MATEQITEASMARIVDPPRPNISCRTSARRHGLGAACGRARSEAQQSCPRHGQRKMTAEMAERYFEGANTYPELRSRVDSPRQVEKTAKRRKSTSVEDRTPETQGRHGGKPIPSPTKAEKRELDSSQDSLKAQNRRKRSLVCHCCRGKGYLTRLCPRLQILQRKQSVKKEKLRSHQMNIDHDEDDDIKVTAFLSCLQLFRAEKSEGCASSGQHGRKLKQLHGITFTVEEGDQVVRQQKGVCSSSVPRSPKFWRRRSSSSRATVCIGWAINTSSDKASEAPAAVWQDPSTPPARALSLVTVQHLQGLVCRHLLRVDKSQGSGCWPVYIACFCPTSVEPTRQLRKAGIAPPIAFLAPIPFVVVGGATSPRGARLTSKL